MTFRADCLLEPFAQENYGYEEKAIRQKVLNPRPVVTGGAGFLASHLTDLLLSRGHKVIAIDNFVTGSVDNISHLSLANPNYKFIQQDVTEFLFLQGSRWISSGTLPRLASPIDYLEIPIPDPQGRIRSARFTRRLGLAKSTKSARLLLASTSEIYGDPLVHPQTVDYWGNVNTCITARAVVTMKPSASPKRWSWRTTASSKVWRRASCASSTPTGRACGCRTAGVVPAFISQALTNKPITQVFGEGRQTRSFCYVSDLLEGIYRLMNSSTFEPVNIGNPHEMTMFTICPGNYCGRRWVAAAG